MVSVLISISPVITTCRNSSKKDKLSWLMSTTVSRCDRSRLSACLFSVRSLELKSTHAPARGRRQMSSSRPIISDVAFKSRRGDTCGPLDGVRRVRVSCTCALGDQSFAATRCLARAGTRRTMAEALFYGFGINERASSPRRPRHSAKPHHRHQTPSAAAAAAAAVGAAGSFTHGKRVNKASAHAIHRGRTQPASDATHGRRPTCVCRTHTHTHTHTHT